MANTKQKTKAAQDFVPIKEVRGGTIIRKDGALVGVLLASSLNFALKSQAEQEAILAQFQNFLNSLDFSIQFFVQSRRLDIRPYVALLEERLRAQTDDLMKIQVKEYIQFVRSFTERANIMSKNFFVVVPYSPPMVDFSKNITSVFGGGRTSSDRSIAFEEQQTQLEQRLAVVEQGLVRCGVRTVPLDTEAAIELLYKEFNPGELEKPIALER